jgi:hypothetical protein
MIMMIYDIFMENDFFVLSFASSERANVSACMISLNPRDFQEFNVV